jgi:hypothetical protein
MRRGRGLARLAWRCCRTGRQARDQTAFTIQNGEMFGPAKLGKAPRIVWE